MLGEDQATARIVRSIAEMAEALGMSVTAEGVEEEGQRRILANLGCTHLQGYLLSRPLVPDQLATLLREHRSNGLVRLFAQD
jgi:EAL domain-containing protein (putative c-di-GMP-specific phosphodiesterase class I)